MDSPIADPGEALDLIAVALKEESPDGVSVKIISGSFDATEIKRHITAAPALLLACLGLSGYTPKAGGGWSVGAEFVLYALTRDTSAQPRGRIAMDLVTMALRVLARSNWGAPSAFGIPTPSTIEATNLYGGDIDSVAAALWAITWRQPIYLNL